jgi:hypothetical protein
MKFKELLNLCSFDDLLPTLLNLMSDHEDSMPAFKIVFDKLRHIEPKSTSIKIHITFDEWISVSCIDPKEEGNCGFCYPWDISLGMEVMLNDNVHLSTPEIVAHCIWEMTFWGFSEEQINHYFEHEDEEPDLSEDGRKIAELDLKILRFKYPVSAKSDYNNTEKVLLNPDNFHICSTEFMTELKKGLRAMNRSKRKRLYRWEKQLEHLERQRDIKKRQRDIKALIRRCTQNSDIKEEELTYLFDTKLISENDFESCADSIDKRAQYLVELLTKYAYDDFTKYTKFCFMFKSSSQHPVTENEKLELSKIKELLPQIADIRFSYVTDDDLGEKLSVLRLRIQL